MLQLGLLEEEAHSAVESATARVDVGLDLHVNDAEIDQILQTASSTGKL